MGNGFLMSQVRRTNRNLFVTNVVILILVIAFFLFNMNYLYNVFSGPFVVDNNWLASITEPNLEKKNFIKFTSEEIYDIDFHDIVEEYNKYTNEVKDTTVKTDYLLVGIDKKFIVVKVPHGNGGTTFTGQIKELPYEVKNYVTEVMTEEGFSNSEITEIIQPILIDANLGSFKTIGYVMVGIGLAFLLLVLWNLSKFARRNSDPYAHPIYKRLSEYGNSEDMAKSLENELEQCNVTMVGKMTITDNWVINKTEFSLWMLRISDLIWIYKRVNSHRINFIPAGKEYSVVLNNNRKTSIPMIVRREAIADKFMEEIYNRAPWIAFGYNEEYKNLWSRNFTQFVEIVESRKSQVNNSTANSEENSQEYCDTGNI